MNLSKFFGVLICLVLLPAVADAVEREVIVYAASPSTPQTVSTVGEIRVGKITLSFPDGSENALEASDWRAHGILEPGWKRSGTDKLDEFNRVTTDTDKFVWDGTYRLRRVSVHTADGAVVLAEYGELEAPALEASADTVGEVYWYQGTDLHRMPITDGVKFYDFTSAHQYRYAWSIETHGQEPRVRGKPLVDRITIRDDVALALQPTAERIALTDIPGAWVIVPIFGTNERKYFQERHIYYADPEDRDPYLLNGLAVTAEAAFVTDGNVKTVYVRSGDHKVDGLVSLTTEGSVYDLPEPWRTAELEAIKPSTPQFDVDRTHSRGELDDQDMVVLESKVREAKANHESAEELRSAVNGVGFNPTDGGDLNPSDKFGSHEDLRAALDPEAIANEQQAQIRSVKQETPRLTEIPESEDIDAMQAAIHKVNNAMAPHMEGGRILPDYEPTPRHAVMHPAAYALPEEEGLLSPNKLGEPIPDGTNPNPARPLGLSPQGAPFYDFDGDGLIDRHYTTDPWEGAYKHLAIHWDFPNDYTKSNYQNWAHPWWVNVVDREGKEQLLFASKTRAGIQVAQRRHGWKLGINYYGPNLVSFVEPLGRANEYKFAMRLIGDLPVLPDRTPSYEVTSVTNTKVIMRTELIEGVPTDFPWISYTEVTDTYTGLVDASELDGAVWSDTSFTPEFTPATPTQPTRITTVRKVLAPNPDQPDYPALTTANYSFPGGFTIDDSEEEDEAIVMQDAWAFEYEGWDPSNYPSAGNASWNFQRGEKFGGDFSLRFNPSDVIHRFLGGQLPLLTAEGIGKSRSPFIRFALKEISDPNPVDMSESEWKKYRSMNHTRTTGFDSRTDMQAGQNFINPKGSRYFEILDGIGFYIFKGARRDYHNEVQQRDLIQEMWDFYFRTPKTVLQIQRINPYDSNSALLNTARARLKGEAGIDNLITSKSGGHLHKELAKGTNSEQAAAERRKRLIEEQVFFFSGARGREWEVEYAKRMPRSVRLICVEWDDQQAVAEMFSTTGHTLEFVGDIPAENRAKGQVITDIYGLTMAHAHVNMGNDQVTVDTLGNDAHIEAVEANPGQYVFTLDHSLYGQPVIGLRSVALLDNGQYGDPRAEQWRESHKAEFRHPMLIYYDDRWSAVVATYGHNADPVKVFGAWESNGPVSLAEGLSDEDLHRMKFEEWTLEDNTRLPWIYDQLNKDAYDNARAGGMTLPPAPPNPGEMPEEPVEPPFIAVQPQPPAVVNPPGPYPNPPVAPWGHLPPQGSHTADYNAWIASGSQRYDYSKPGTAMFDGYDRPKQERRRDSRDDPWEYYWVTGPDKDAYITNRSWWDAHRYDNVDIYSVITNSGSGTTRTFHGITDDGVRITVNGSAIIDRYLAGSTQWWSTSGFMRSGHNVVKWENRDAGGHGSYRFNFNGSRMFSMGGQFEIYPYYPDKFLNFAAASRDEYLRKVEIYPDTVEAWQIRDAAYTEYLDRLDTYRRNMEAYQDALVNYSNSYESYVTESEAYPEVLERWEAAKKRRDDWEALRDSIESSAGLWASYRAARDAWVTLAEVAIAEPGVNWSGPDTPVFEGYHWWSENTEIGREFP